MEGLLGNGVGVGDDPGEEPWRIVGMKKVDKQLERGGSRGKSLYPWDHQ